VRGAPWRARAARQGEDNSTLPDGWSSLCGLWESWGPGTCGYV
jgi:hypothetical protein